MIGAAIWRIVYNNCFAINKNDVSIVIEVIDLNETQDPHYIFHEHTDTLQQ